MPLANFGPPGKGRRQECMAKEEQIEMEQGRTRDDIERLAEVLS